MKHLLAAALLLAACGKASTLARNPGAGGPATGDLPLAGNAVTIGTVRPPEGGTYFDLIAPPLAAGQQAEPVRAQLAGAATTYTLTAFHITGPTWPGTPVAAGTYTLTYLDETGAKTTFAQSVEVAANQGNYIVLGGIAVSPVSAVNAERVGTKGMRYQITDTAGHTLRRVAPALGAVVDLPAGSWLWYPLAYDGVQQLAPLAFATNESITPFAWGSVYIRRNDTQSLRLQAATGELIDPALTDRVEYLLPIAPQSEGCRVYDFILDQLTPFRRTLCSDAVAHATLNVR
jgi:hypothetical protein